jgi:hypothetical protein
MESIDKACKSEDAPESLSISGVEDHGLLLHFVEMVFLFRKQINIPNRVNQPKTTISLLLESSIHIRDARRKVNEARNNKDWKPFESWRCMVPFENKCKNTKQGCFPVDIDRQVLNAFVRARCDSEDVFSGLPSVTARLEYVFGSKALAFIQARIGPNNIMLSSFSVQAHKWYFRYSKFRQLDQVSPLDGALFYWLRRHSWKVRNVIFVCCDCYLF